MKHVDIFGTPCRNSICEKQFDEFNFSFHVGSGCQEAEAFSKAISAASVIFREAEKLGMKLELLDIGGGFPGHEQDDTTFAQISRYINTGLAEYFPDNDGLRIIAEPGRYYASAAYTLVANIIGKIEHLNTVQ